MRLLLPLLALSAISPAVGDAPAPQKGFFPEIRKGVAPDERRALVIGKALWESAAGSDYQAMTRFSVRRVGEAWLLSATTPNVETPSMEKVEAFDGVSYLAFDSRDGGFFYASPYQMPKDRDLIELLRRRRAMIKRGVE